MSDETLDLNKVNAYKYSMRGARVFIFEGWFIVCTQTFEERPVLGWTKSWAEVLPLVEEAVRRAEAHDLRHPDLHKPAKLSLDDLDLGDLLL